MAVEKERLPWAINNCPLPEGKWGPRTHNPDRRIHQDCRIRGRGYRDIRARANQPAPMPVRLRRATLGSTTPCPEPWGGK